MKRPLSGLGEVSPSATAARHVIHIPRVKNAPSWIQYLGSSLATGRNITKLVIIDVDSNVSGWNYDILASIFAQLLTSRPFPDLHHYFVFPAEPPLQDLTRYLKNIALGLLFLNLGFVTLP